jgi:hypothetical protein
VIVRTLYLIFVRLVGWMALLVRSVLGMRRRRSRRRADARAALHEALAYPIQFRPAAAATSQP